MMRGSLKNNGSMKCDVRQKKERFLSNAKSLAWTFFRRRIVRPRKKKQRREVEGHHTKPNISVHGTASVSEQGVLVHQRVS